MIFLLSIWDGFLAGLGYQLSMIAFSVLVFFGIIVIAVLIELGSLAIDERSIKKKQKEQK